MDRLKNEYRFKFKESLVGDADSFKYASIVIAEIYKPEEVKAICEG